MQLPSGLYSQYTEVLDSSPFMKYNLERRARIDAEKQAKDEALNQYFTDLQGKINTAGVRVQDLDSEHGGINKDIEGWRQSWLANKDEIKKGGLAQQEHLAKYNEILRKIDQSKGRAKLELEIGKAKFEGKYDPTEDDLGVLANIGKSIYDPTSYKKDRVSEYGWQDLSPSIPDFDADRQGKFWAGATKGMTAGKIYDYDKKRTDVTTGQAIIPYSKKYSAEQIKQIADETGDLVTGDKSALKYYSGVINDPNSDKWQQLNAAYQSVYGKDKRVSTPQQAAQADAIIRASAIQEKGEEQELNRQQAQQYKINNIIMSSGGGGASGSTIRDVFSEINDAVTKKPNGQPLNELTTTAQSVILKQARDLMGDNDLSQSQVYITRQSDGKIVIKKASKPRVMSSNDAVIGEMDFTGTNINVQPGVNEKRDVVELGKNKTTKPSNNKKTKVYKGLDKSGNPIFE